MTTIAMEEYELMKDSKYRMYVAAVDKALKSFEYTSEWADLISALGKLNKVLSTYTKFPVIPRRIKIGKRLAQCMHPALPSGVHLRALETYDIIFRCMGTVRLSSELFIYSAGLFPLMGHAAMNIRPVLLTVYETHFVPLGERLRPALSGFLSGTLLGLEAGSDHFDRTNALLEVVCESVDPTYFYTCLWQCIVANSLLRLPAVSFVLAHYTRRLPMSDQLHLLGRDMDLMVRGLCAAVRDSSVLVQRAALDLLMACFPIGGSLLVYEDMVKLVTAALSVILRRDMSLNRRLYSWILDTLETNLAVGSSSAGAGAGDELKTLVFDEKDESEPHSIAYELLNDALRVILKKSTSEVPIDVRPYRLLLSLFEKPQIGPIILDSILYDVFRALYTSCLYQQKHKSSSNSVRCVSFNGDIESYLKGHESSTQVLSKDFVVRNCQDLIKNANLLFNTLQNYYIWSYVERLYKDSLDNIDGNRISTSTTRNKVVNDIGTGPPDVLEICVLTDFLLDIIPTESYAENSSKILPNLFTSIVVKFRTRLGHLNEHETSESLRLCTKILSKIQPTSVMVTKNELESVPDLTKKELEFESLDVPKTSLEKSKSDSKINENFIRHELLLEESLRERSYSNQMIKKKEKSSPRVDKNARNKKSKSSSRLDDLRNEEEEDLVNSNSNDALVPGPPEQQPEPAPKMTLTKPKVDMSHFINCLEQYKSFYVAFIKTKILPDTVDIERCFENYVCDKDDRTKRLQKLLVSCLENRDRDDNDLSQSQIIPKEDDGCGGRSSGSPSSEFETAMNLTSNILLEFSTFPNLLKENHTDVNFPLWLKALIVTACHSGAPPAIQLIAMTTLFDIFSLAKTQTHLKDDNGNTNIDISGILHFSHINYIEDFTFVIEEMTKILWDIFGSSSNQSQVVTCANLLYQIHNIFETKLFVENIIGKYLVPENVTVNYLKSFFVLWHLGRDLNLKLLPNKSKIRNFDRCLLKVLDNLQNRDRAHLQLLSEKFLTHSLLHNDVPRIVYPMMSKLLAPNTARVSIKHVSLQDPGCSDGEDVRPDRIERRVSVRKVSAVSNINGNIMYHVTDGVSPKPKKKWFSKPDKKSPSPVVSTTASVLNDENVVTKKSKDFGGYSNGGSVKLDKYTGDGNVKLFINPLSSKEIYPKGIDGSYKKLGSSCSSDESLDSGSLHASCDSLIKGFPANESFRCDNGRSNKSSSKRIFEKIEPVCDGIKDGKMIKSQSFDDKRCCNEKNSELSDVSLVHSWSYSLSDPDTLNAELELSTSAEDFFKVSEKAFIVDILDTILNKVYDVSEEWRSSSRTPGRPADLDLKSTTSVGSSQKKFVLYPIHSHMCMYREVFDSNQVFYALQTLKNCVLSNPQLFIKCLATSGVNNLKNNDVLYLLARHKSCLAGNDFGAELNNEVVNFYRGYMFLDAVVSICLNFSCTFYSCLTDGVVSQDDIGNNIKIQLESLEILDAIVRNLIVIVKDNSKGFSSYIADMLVKCKLQNVVLHCLLTSVRNIDDDVTFAEEILLYNNFRLYDDNGRVGEHAEAFQMQILKLLNSLIVLEYHIYSRSATAAAAAPAINQDQASAALDVNNYTPAVLIPQQQMFLSAVMGALRHRDMKNLHEKWLDLVTSCLPYFGDNLKQITISVIHQICNNIEEISYAYKSEETEGELCTDYAVTQLESLTVICHYCLLDSSQSVGLTQNGPASSAVGPLLNSSEILNNLFNVFFAPISGDAGMSLKQNSDHYMSARKTILSHMPRIISSVAKLWQMVVDVDKNFNGVYGNSKVVKQQLLEFLSPIYVHHGSSFLAAIAVAWYERRNPFTNVKTVLPEPNAGQNNLVYLISAIRVIPLDNLVQTVTSVIKSPPQIEGLSADICLDVCVLEVFYCYMRNASATQLSEAWTSLLNLIREGCGMAPQAQFLIAALLHELMIKCCPVEDRKDQKDLQDVTAKLIECVAVICGSCLEQTTWLRRNLAVKEQDGDSLPDSSIASAGSGADAAAGTNHSVQAQLVLSEILAPIIDICFGSSEKDKVNGVLASLMCNIVPYLRTHTTRNMPSFQACSKLLASLSSYQYTRKAWKKDVYELLLDNVFFQVDYPSLKYWRTIIDNLMTHDNTTFRDLMGRVALTQSGSLSIFSSREQEYEQKAQLLKRLAYVIFCSEIDQYAKYMPDIQEQLTSSLRLNIPSIQAQVFICFRVILIRMSPLHITSLWPIIISELLQVFQQIEQELSTDTEEFSSHIKLLSSLDASWSMNSNNGLHALGNPHWLKLQLSAAKLLDLALLLPATSLPQFQMYRWAFVGDDLDRPDSHSAPSFVPHVIKVANLMDNKFTDTQIETLPMKRNELLLTSSSIVQLRDLHGFFKTLSICSNRHRSECSRTVSSDQMLIDRSTDKKLNCILEKIDKVVEQDFLDKIPR